MKIEDKILRKTYLNFAHYPNKKTLKAIEDAEKGKSITAHKDMTDLFKKLGIKKKKTNSIRYFLFRALILNLLKD